MLADHVSGNPLRWLSADVHAMFPCVHANGDDMEYDLGDGALAVYA